MQRPWGGMFRKGVSIVSMGMTKGRGGGIGQVSRACIVYIFKSIKNVFQLFWTSVGSKLEPRLFFALSVAVSSKKLSPRQCCPQPGHPRAGSEPCTGMRGFRLRGW